jgi:hypothetical protein
MNATVPAQAALAPANSQASAASDVIAFLTMIERAARDPAVDLDKLERLLVWKDKTERRAAELAFSEALAAAQAQMAPIRTDAVNTHANNSRYASLAAMDDAVRKIYTDHGFSLTFDTEDITKPDYVRLICDVSHTDGNTRRYHIDMPADGKGARGGDVMTRTHATGSAITYGRRYLLGMVFNLAVTRAADDDGNAAGGRRSERQQQPQLPSPGVQRFDDMLAAEFPSPHQERARQPVRNRRGPACAGRTYNELDPPPHDYVPDGFDGRYR